MLAGGEGGNRELLDRERGVELEELFTSGKSADDALSRQPRWSLGGVAGTEQLPFSGGGVNAPDRSNADIDISKKKYKKRNSSRTRLFKPTGSVKRAEEEKREAATCYTADLPVPEGWFLGRAVPFRRSSALCIMKQCFHRRILDPFIQLNQRWWTVVASISPIHALTARCIMRVTLRISSRSILPGRRCGGRQRVYYWVSSGVRSQRLQHLTLYWSFIPTQTRGKMYLTRSTNFFRSWFENVLSKMTSVLKITILLQKVDAMWRSLA